MAYKRKTIVTMSQAEKDLRAEYKALAKRADQRLVRLEEYAARGEYKDIMQWAYAGAQYDIRSFFGTEANRFNRKLSPSLSLIQITARVNAVKKFLEAETSTISPTRADTKYGVKGVEGVLSMYKRRANSFNQTMGTDFTWQEFAEFMEEKMYASLIDKLEYKVTKLRLGRVKETREKIIEEMRAHKRPGRINDPKAVVKAITEELLKGEATDEELKQARKIKPKEKVRRKRRNN